MQVILTLIILLCLFDVLDYLKRIADALGKSAHDDEDEDAEESEVKG